MYDISFKFVVFEIKYGRHSRLNYFLMNMCTIVLFCIYSTCFKIILLVKFICVLMKIYPILLFHNKYFIINNIFIKNFEKKLKT